MFGYIRPLKSELKIREYECYRAAYCGLCNSLRKRFGMSAGFILNYDFTFLALLLSYSENFDTSVVKKRCLVCPTGRKCIQSEAYDKAADISVILTYLKLSDDVSDSSFFGGLFRARIPRAFLRNAYSRAAKRCPDYHKNVRSLYADLCGLEQQKIPSLDEPADKFALMLASIAESDCSNKRILHEMFYHIGRFIYIIDALDDFENDVENNEYNPIEARYGEQSKTDKDIVKAEVVETLRQSARAVLRAFELLDSRDNAGLIRNIIELGMEASIQRVINKEK